MVQNRVHLSRADTILPDPLSCPLGREPIFELQLWELELRRDRSCKNGAVTGLLFHHLAVDDGHPTLAQPPPVR